MRLPPSKVRRIGPDGNEYSKIRSRFRDVNALLGEVDARPRAVASRWANLLIAVAFLAVVYCTLFPFNFTVPAGQTIRQAAMAFDWRVYDPSDPRDTLDNIILFLPFGFALGCWVKRHGWANWTAPLIALGISAIFSSTIETLQMWLPTRDSSLADICSNTTGGALGALIYLAIGAHVLTLTEKAMVLARGYLTFWRLAPLFILAWVATLYSPLHVYHDGRNLVNWHPYHLSLGNIPTGDRPWNGSVQLLEISSQALSPAEAARVTGGTALREITPTAISVAYKPDLTNDASNLAGDGPALKWVGPGRPDPATPAESMLSRDHWLESTEPVAALTEAVRKTSAFSCHVIFTTQSPLQRGLPRIFAISPNPYAGDITLAQEGTDLAIRLRTVLSGDNGTNPTWMVHNLLAPGSLTHDIVISYSDPMLRVYVDGALSGAPVATPPEFFSLGRLMARLPMLPLGGFGLEVYRILYYLAFFAPLGILLGLMAADVRTPLRTRQIFAIFGVVLPTLGLVIVFGVIGGRGLRADQFLLGPGVLMGVLLLTRSWIIRHLGRYDAAKSPTNVIEVPGR